MSATRRTPDHLSIGDLAEATSVPVETLRMWERRYGHPASIRLPSGHRRYSQDQVRWVRRVAEAVSRGVRPSKAIAATPVELDALICTDPLPAPEVSAEWTDAARSLDAPTFRAMLAHAATGLSTVEFISTVAAPMLVAIGRAWVEGLIDVRHEHFVSEIVAEDLGLRRARARARPDGPRLVLAALPDERHSLGLQLAATVAAESGARCTVLGADTPLAETAAAVEEVGADAVAVSVSVVRGGVAANAEIRALRAALPERVRLFVGGSGVRVPRRAPRGIEFPVSFARFDRTLRQMTAAPESPVGP